MYKTVYTEVEVDVDLSDFETDDLIEELESRNEWPVDTQDNRWLLESIYLKRRMGQDYQRELDILIYNTLGKVI